MLKDVLTPIPIFAPVESPDDGNRLLWDAAVEDGDEASDSVEVEEPT